MCYYKKELKKIYEKIALNAYNASNSKKLTQFSDLKTVTKTDAIDNNGNAISVEDQFVALIDIQLCPLGFGYIKYIKEAIDNEKDRKKIDEELSKEKYPTIALVLESPHKSEFKNNNYCPAIGTTGKNIKDYFLKELSDYFCYNYGGGLVNIQRNIILKNGYYRLKLINAIQYQCSLGVKTSNYRDTIFKKCWHYDVFKNNFIYRLKEAKASLIINCCTGQSDGEIKGLQKEVQDEIDEMCNNAKKLYGYHPSSYHFLKGLKDCF